MIAVSERGTMFNPGPCFYMEKIAVGPDAAGAIDITAIGHAEPALGRQGQARRASATSPSSSSTGDATND